MRSKRLPPRIDAPPERIAAAMFRPLDAEPPEQDYSCASCGNEMVYPDVLHDDGRCGRCHE